ncbi:MAG: winged helix-turn-helix domain-containing protein [Candidatus Bathyarchaeota archaeon]|jgi:DNA-binding transcriptional ArsR family regulator
MKLKLQLVRGNEVLFEIPLSPADWPKEQLENELQAFEADCQRFSKIFDALSHETRLRMMKRLVEEEDHTMNFADFMRDLDLNPKIVWENAKKLTEGGLVEKIDRGKYRCSEIGQTGFILMSLAFRHLMEALDEMESFWRGES